jgi:hypothetical protein
MLEKGGSGTVRPFPFVLLAIFRPASAFALMCQRCILAVISQRGDATNTIIRE